MQSKIYLVVPCYNEQDRLDIAAFRGALETLPGLNLMFVDDGSSDETFKILQKFAKSMPDRIDVLMLKTNQGKAEAVRQGVLASLEIRPDYVGYWDADLATPLEEVAKMHAYFSNQDIVLAMGARVKLLGRQIERYALRHYIGRIFATLVSAVLRLAVYDTQCGAKLFRVNDVTVGAFADPFASRWVFDVEIIARLQKLGLDANRAIIEHPLQVWKDVSGSKLKLKDFLIAGVDLLRIFSITKRN